MNVLGPPPLPAESIWQDISPLKKVEENPLNGKRLAEIVKGGVGFSAVGYGVYWIIRFVDKKKWFDIDPKAIQPIPYVIIGAINAVVPEITLVVYDFVLYFMGNREDFENLADPDTASFGDHVRHHCWGVVHMIEGLEENIDGVYSHIFHVRTSKEIRDNHIWDRNLTTMEIVRYASVTQINETALSIIQSIPGEIGVYAAEALGYTVLGGHFFMFFIYLAPIMALAGVANKIMQVYDRIDADKYFEPVAAENQAYCHLLAELYAGEIAEFEDKCRQEILDDDGFELIEMEETDIESEEIEESDTEVEEEEDELQTKEFLSLPAGIDITSIELRRVLLSDLKAKDDEDIVAYHPFTALLEPSRVQWLSMRNESADDYDIDGVEVNGIKPQDNCEEEYIEVDESEVPDDFVMSECELIAQDMSEDVIEKE